MHAQALHDCNDRYLLPSRIIVGPVLSDSVLVVCGAGVVVVVPHLVSKPTYRMANSVNLPGGIRSGYEDMWLIGENP